MESKIPMKNLDAYARSPLCEALEKYDEDWKFLGSYRKPGRFLSVGTFHDWLALEYRDPDASYPEDEIERRFSV